MKKHHNPNSAEHGDNFYIKGQQSICQLQVIDILKRFRLEIIRKQSMNIRSKERRERERESSCLCNQFLFLDLARHRRSGRFDRVLKLQEYVVLFDLLYTQKTRSTCPSP